LLFEFVVSATSDAAPYDGQPFAAIGALTVAE
jgi:hypothetical protein